MSLEYDLQVQPITGKTWRSTSKTGLATDLCLSWPKVLNLVTVRGLMKTPV